MKPKMTNLFTIRLKEDELIKLTVLAKEQGRSKGAIMRRLLAIADLPEARRLIEGLAITGGGDNSTRPGSEVTQ